MDDVRHILSLSGGKDSTALAIYMRDRVPNMEYVFCDTHKELPETYEYLDKLEAYLGKKIVRLSDERGFDHWLRIYGNYLPSSRMRWCTKVLKIKPFEKYVGDDNVLLYVGIRADENRSAYVSTKPNIKAVMPFKDDDIDLASVARILDNSGIGLPSYYEWRTRSGCYFCFFQRKKEWAELSRRHPDLFEESKRYEKFDEETGVRFTWNQKESLDELAAPDRLAAIDVQHLERMAREKKRQPNQPLFQILEDVLDGEDDDEPCTFCHS
jgi:3'-phosphoadenosine 5'-phosphosulfate sulfotransferase (PAPS reductase)/FAD synthetase